MARPLRFEHFQWLGDKRHMVVHDLDDATEACDVDELMASEQFQAFGPDILPKPAIADTAHAATASHPVELPARVTNAPLVSDGLRLESHLARAPISAARDASRSGLVIAHPLPSGPGSAASANSTFPELADRVAQDTGWAVLSFSFRGAGKSPGAFSPAGWQEDLVAAVEMLRSEAGSVWLAGFGFGGSLALRVAADDLAIGGVAALAALSDLAPMADDPGAIASSAHEAGLVASAKPDGLELWSDELRALDPLRAAETIPPRPLLIVHGSGDESVPLVEARALADAAAGAAELRVIAMAGHRLRHDPRAIAILLGWLQRREN